jgi:hypothetical protein
VATSVGKTILPLGGTITPEDKAKTRNSKRRVWLNEVTVALLRAHRNAQLAARAAGFPVSVLVSGGCGVWIHEIGDS